MCWIYPPLHIYLPFPFKENQLKNKCASILIVEDDKETRNLMLTILKEEGYLVEVASDGLEGLEKLSKVVKPTLVLLDLLLPDMSGWEFINQIENRQIYDSIEIVIVTALMVQDKSANAKEFIRKPFQIETLLGIADKYCSKRDKE